MLKNILNLEGVRELSRNQQKSISGGYNTWCRRRSENLVDLRCGGPCPPREGYHNSNGCWIYPGMPYNAHPDIPPGHPAFFGIG